MTTKGQINVARRVVALLADGYGIEDVRVKTGFSFARIAVAISDPPNRDKWEPHRRLAAKWAARRRAA